MYDYNNKSNEKQGLKSKKPIHLGVRIGSSLQRNDDCINNHQRVGKTYL